MAIAGADLQRGFELVDLVYSLREPWLSRFVELIEERAGASRIEGHAPSRMQVAVWLSDACLGDFVGQMLHAWMH